MVFFEKTENKLLVFAALLVFTFIFAFYFEPLLTLLHALNRAIYSGYSTGKLIASFAWFTLFALLSAIALKLKLSAKLYKVEKILLALFITLVALGFFLGAFQFQSFASNYKPRWLFATIVYEPSYKNWEASKFYHNHFPKATLYYAEQLFGIDFGQKFDNGRPWFEFLPSVREYTVAYFIIAVLAILIFLTYIFSIAHKLSFFDFLLASASSLGLIVYMLDGGIAAVPMSSVLFLFSLFLIRRYLTFCKEHLCKAAIALAFAFSANLLSIAIFNYYIPANAFQIMIVLFMFAAYALFFEIKKLFAKRRIAIRNALVLLILICILLYSLCVIRGTLEVYLFGKFLVDYSELGYANAMPGAGLFIYGLPAELSKETLAEELQKYGQILELEKTGWTAFARIKPAIRVTDKQITDELRRRFKPSTYLYVQELAAIPTYEAVYIYWPEPIGSKKYLRDRFNDIEVIKRIDKGRETVLIVRAYTGPTWQLLSVLTEIKENGYKGRPLVAK
jgi:hypothetical protein